ncbi:MAG: outer membrane protein heavy metal efflux system [Acidobacteriota bacterium]|jgi:cobalt-zinc-cadmium efflux system outer membrane protein|nr:outer membrane protein heavy metal efflux system [Acidobacteriota bacterium]
MRQAAWLPAITAVLLASGCVSVPRDAGMSEVQKRIEEQGLKIAWSPDQPIEPPADERLRPLLEGELTVERAVEIALANNRGLLATLEGLGVARADLIAASTLRNPVFDGEVRFPGDPRNPFEIGITQTLIDLFQLRKRRALGQAGFEAARLRVTGSVLGFAAEVRTHYYTLQAAQQALAQQRTIHAAAEASAELARRQHEAGNISDLDLESEQASYERAKLDLARAELDELQTRERLLADLGALENVPLTLPSQTPPMEDGQERSLEELEAAMPQRLDLSLAQAEVEAARQALPLARASGYDELALGVRHERESDGAKTTGPSVAVPIPIFDRGMAGRTRAVASLRMAEQRLHALNVTARSEARAARERLLEARARAEYLRTVIVPRRQRILYLTQLEYNAMLRGAFDLIRARQGLSDALREQVLATRDYWLARTELDAAMSGVLGFRSKDNE